MNRVRYLLQRARRILALMFIARLDLLLPDACWTELCTWALYGAGDLPFRERCRNGIGCRAQSSVDGSCYCGKYENGALVK